MRPTPVRLPAAWNCPPPPGSRYRVRAHGGVTAAALKNIAASITIDGIRYGPIEAVLDRVKGSNVLTRWR